MKINEVEELLNIPRANIRYYEKEELIQPKRKANGYREYNEDDIEKIKKIIIFRKLGISVVEIKGLLDNEMELQEILTANINNLQAQIEELNGALKICEDIKQEQINLEEFDSNVYWKRIFEEESAGRKFADICKDVLEIEENVFASMLSGAFFYDYKKTKEGKGAKLAIAFAILFIIGRCIGNYFTADTPVHETLLHFGAAFVGISVLVLVILLVAKKSEKVASIIVMTILGLLLIALIAAILAPFILVIFF